MSVSLFCCDGERGRGGAKEKKRKIIVWIDGEGRGDS
jgi:hypothetical protein